MYSRGKKIKTNQAFDLFTTPATLRRKFNIQKIVKFLILFFIVPSAGYTFDILRLKNK